MRDQSSAACCVSVSIVTVVAAVHFEYGFQIVREVAPVHGICVHTQQVMTRPATCRRATRTWLRSFERAGLVVRIRCAGHYRFGQNRAAASRERRIERQPARHRAYQTARAFEAGFMAKRAWRRLILLAECAAEVRGIVESPAKADVGNRHLLVQRIHQFGPAAFEPSQPEIGGEALPDSFEQFLQVAR